MIFLKALVLLFVCTGGMYVGVHVAQTTLSAYWIGAGVSLLAVAIIEGG